MSDDYTPTTDEIREVIAWRHRTYHDSLTPESFDRMVDDLRRGIRAEQRERDARIAEAANGVTVATAIRASWVLDMAEAAGISVEEPADERGGIVTTVTTVEELDALPVGSVVIENDSGPFLGIPTVPGVFHKFPESVWGSEGEGWYVVAGKGPRASDQIELPATVLLAPSSQDLETPA